MIFEVWFFLIDILVSSKKFNSVGSNVKVTINECIDIAKNFSSPKSGNFVNGLLDVISLNLQKSRKINKTGKGLIDNK